MKKNFMWTMAALCVSGLALTGCTMEDNPYPQLQTVEKQLLNIDFETGQASDYWTKGVGYLVTPEVEGSTGQAASIKQGSDRADYMLLPAEATNELTKAVAYNVDFDIMINNGAKTAFLTVMSQDCWLDNGSVAWNNWGYFWDTTTTANGQHHNPYLLALTLPGNEATAYVNEHYNGETGFVNNGDSWSFTYSSWYHVTLNVDVAAHSVAYKFTNKADDKDVTTGKYAVPEGESTIIKGIYERNNRYNYDPGAIVIDNIKVVGLFKE